MNEAAHPHGAFAAPGPAPSLYPGWTVEPNYRRLPGVFYTLMAPEQVGEQPVLLHANARAAGLLDLDPAFFGDPAFAEIFSGHRPVDGFESLAMVYSGHQFGHYVPQLGDGRALLIAQVRNRRGELWDVQLKGAGRTPYSRFADGRAVLRSSIREYLGSEAVAALGIPTTRALALVGTGETVRRELPEPGAVLTRLSPSHIRFGHFEYFHHTERAEAVGQLADHVIAEHFPHLAGRDDRYAAWFAEVVQRTARLIAQWQSVGFAHGVMNTDNMSILGLTIDYGPFGFLDAYDPGFICNHSDHMGRYAFDQQPAVGFWNLQALALALTSLMPVEQLRAGLQTYAATFSQRWLGVMRGKLGLADAQETDEKLVGDLLGVMARAKSDYTLTFRRLSHATNANTRGDWLSLFGDAADDAASWLERYAERLAKEPAAVDRAHVMAQVNPKYVLRNWVAETAIRAVQQCGDMNVLDEILRVMQSPFADHPDAEKYAAAPPAELQDLCVSCSS